MKEVDQAEKLAGKFREILTDKLITHEVAKQKFSLYEKVPL